MKPSKKSISIILGVLIPLLALYFYSAYNESFTSKSVSCTEEAKVCLDGSVVGRTGKECAFAECPSVATTALDASSSSASVSKKTTNGLLLSKNRITTSLNQKASALNVSFTASKVMEDSRCPVEVRCLSAGVVRLKTELTGKQGRETVTLSLGMPYFFSGTKITLVRVTPNTSTQRDINPSSYKFEFLIEKAVY
jgi:hypothetical protein